MELTAIAAALLRRWYVVLLGLVLTAGLVYVAHEKVPPTYDATASVLLLPPQESLDAGANPLLQLAGLDQPASLVVAYLSGEGPTKVWNADHPTSTREIVVDPQSRGPILIFTVHDPTSAAVMDALTASTDQVPGALTSLQDEVDAPGDARIQSAVLTADIEPTTNTSKSLRALIAAAGLGIAATLAGAVALDGLARRRRANRAARASEDASTAAPVPTITSREGAAVAHLPRREAAAATRRSSADAGRLERSGRRRDESAASPALPEMIDLEPPAADAAAELGAEDAQDLAADEPDLARRG